MTDFPTLSYASTRVIPTLSYTWSVKKVHLQAGAILWSAPPPPGEIQNHANLVQWWSCRNMVTLLTHRLQIQRKLIYVSF